MIYFELIFIKDVRSRLRFFFFSLGCPIAPAPFVESTVLPTSSCSCPFVKNQLAELVWVYFGDFFCPIALCPSLLWYHIALITADR